MIFNADRSERRKAVPGYAGRYEVGDLGRVYSNGAELALIDGRFVNLSRNGVVTRCDVAYLVARAFISNVEARPWVRHKDGDLRNNRVENLEWVEYKGKHAGGRPPQETRGILQYDMDGVCIARYSGLHQAAKVTGYLRSLIKGCADGKTKTAKGYIWRYE